MNTDLKVHTTRHRKRYGAGRANYERCTSGILSLVEELDYERTDRDRISALVSDGGEEFGAVRQVSPELVIYVENAGDFVVPLAAVESVHSQKVILNCNKLDPRLRQAIGGPVPVPRFPPAVSTVERLRACGNDGLPGKSLREDGCSFSSFGCA